MKKLVLPCTLIFLVLGFASGATATVYPEFYTTTFSSPLGNLWVADSNADQSVTVSSMNFVGSGGGAVYYRYGSLDWIPFDQFSTVTIPTANGVRQVYLQYTPATGIPPTAGVVKSVDGAD